MATLRNFARVLITLALTGSLGSAVPAAAQSPSPAPPAAGRSHDGALRILLTNDDGYAFPFLHGLRQALIAAGHDVTVVAPATDSSGTGTAVNARFGTTVRARQESPGVWSVAGSPSDAVSFALQRVYGEAPPDLVVSGPNAGQNIAAVTNHSGTVGAAITAIEKGVPAIAFSTAVDVTTDPPSFPSLKQSIAFAVRMVDRLRATARGGELLPPRTALNVNYPLKPVGKVSLARLGTSSFVSAAYAPAPDACPDCYRILPVLSTGPDPVPGSDHNLLNAGHVTVTPLDGSWEIHDPAVTARLGLRLRPLTP
ncbi:5'/3'-nucleotidase SurE [Planomonospora sp. ID67723]|uniref:5'/3'-nucleotidase SurE n=1 Tax=Planomonospora sp. ID67723 TaxID=2738134 RepID=UPI0018C35BE5|nr:5'/3'-nucleotidase SurE [Planomonospora sp. ID67723]MBG0829003.1 5'/3'-nucleotidase SurE [Planomonospora sp. ID67723]